jgi:hypothetical protein
VKRDKERIESMREQIQLLIKLQQIDNESQRQESALSAIPQRLASLDGERREVDQAVWLAEQGLEALNRDYRDLERENKACEAQIAKSKVKLAAVKTNKEYQMSLKEIEDLEAKRSRIEDDVLRVLENIDEAKALLTKRKKESQNIKEQVAQDEREVAAEGRKIEENLARLAAERAALVGQVRSDVLAAFAMVKRRVGRGLTIAPVESAICRGCNVGIPPQLFNEIQRQDKLYHCPNCQRLVYWQGH